MKYSIITINYNNRDGLEKTILSVINQTCQDFEYIIIDGGSTDGSVDVIKKYADRIDYWVSEPDKGIYNAMNKGILQAHGEYLNFMNSGDFFYDNEVLEKVLLENYNVDIIFGKAFVNNSEVTYCVHKEISLYSLCITGFNHQATFYKKILFDNLTYDESLLLLSDWKFTTQQVIFHHCSYKFIDIIIVDYNLFGISSNNKDLAKKEQIQIIQSLLPERISNDYIYFSHMRSPLIEIIPFLSSKDRLHKLIIIIVKIIIKLYKLISKE